jgi:putative membrane protein
MMTSEVRGNPFRLLVWQWRRALFYLGTATAAWMIIEPLGFEALQLPVTPISIVGAAVGIFVSFRANQSYDRWWEGRKLWGRMINSSRHFCDQLLRYTAPEDAEQAQEMVIRHIAYVHTLRCLLRGQSPFDDPDYKRMGPNTPLHRESTNLTHLLLDEQLTELVALNNAGRLAPLRLQSMDSTLMDFLNIQGGCERIKGTPIPRGYAFIVEMLIQLFAVMLPFSLVHELGWVAIPFNALVCLSFALISEAGRVLEDPFTMFFNGLPLHNLSTKIERNLRQRMGHDLPPPVVADHRGILM